jgi:hypothetical protein
MPVLPIEECHDMLIRVAAMIPAVLAVALGGCASPILKADTADVTSSISDVYTDQTLENLSRFIDDPNTIPSLVDLKDGTVEVDASFNPSVTIPFGNQVATTVVGNAGETITAPSRAFTLGGSVGRKVSWSILPIVDADRLRGSMSLFRYAVGENPKNLNDQLCWAWVNHDIDKHDEDYDLGKHGRHRLSMTRESYNNGCLAKLVLALLAKTPSSEKKPGT